MAADINDKFNQATTTSRPSPTVLTAQKLMAAASITVNSTAGWPTDTAVHFIMYQVDANDTKVANTQTEWKGIVSSSTSITSLTLKAGTDQVYPVGSKVIASATAAWADDVVEGIAVEHNQDGTHKISQLLDTNGNELIKFTQVASAVNEATLTNAAAGNAPSLTATGGDTNVGLNLASKGTGEVQINGVPVSGPSSDWVPTYTNFTLGNGTVVAKYKKTGKWVKGTISILLGSTSNISGQLLFSLPSTAAARYTGSGAGIYALGSAYVEDAGNAGYPGIIKNFSTTQAFFSVINASGTYGVDSFVRSNVPVTLGTGDFMTGTFVYEEA